MLGRPGESAVPALIVTLSLSLTLTLSVEISFVGVTNVKEYILKRFKCARLRLRRSLEHWYCGFSRTPRLLKCSCLSFGTPAKHLSTYKVRIRVRILG